MSKKSLPTVFISHGAPSLLLEDIPAREFLKKLGKRYSNVNAVICISAHWMTHVPTVNMMEKFDTIHDFYGFPSELYSVEYHANGDLELARLTSELIQNSGIPCELDNKRGLDHGAWIPLKLMFPKANMPVFQLSIQNNMDPEKHYALGRAIGELRQERVLILGSGGAVHPLGYAPLRPGAKTDQWALDFDSWLTKELKMGNYDEVKNYSKFAPTPEKAHPYPDHFMPLITSMGAAEEGSIGDIIHHSWYWGDLGMGAYEFIR